MARENVRWGYKRIEGALHNLGYTICSSPAANILKKHGIPPAPARKRTTSWSTFLEAHWDVCEGIDLPAITLWLGELARFVFGRVSHSEPTRCVRVAESDEETPNRIMFTIHCSIVPEPATHSARAQPIRTDALPFTSPRKIRHAA